MTFVSGSAHQPPKASTPATIRQSRGDERVTAVCARVGVYKDPSKEPIYLPPKLINSLVIDDVGTGLGANPAVPREGERGALGDHGLYKVAPRPTPPSGRHELRQEDEVRNGITFELRRRDVQLFNNTTTSNGVQPPEHSTTPARRRYDIEFNAS